MTTVDDILQTIKTYNKKPIYEIFCIEHPDKELIYPTGKHSGFPDEGSSYTAGFYYDINDAIEAVTYNYGDIHETCYNACFVLCRFPGLYQAVSKESRMYFVFNQETKEYEQKEEPEIFSHIAY